MSGDFCDRSDKERLDWLDEDWDRLDDVRAALDRQPPGTDLRFVIDLFIRGDVEIEPRESER